MNPANLQKAASELEALARQLQQRSPQEATIKQRATAIRSEWGPVLSSQSRWPESLAGIIAAFRRAEAFYDAAVTTLQAAAVNQRVAPGSNVPRSIPPPNIGAGGAQTPTHRASTNVPGSSSAVSPAAVRAPIQRSITNPREGVSPQISTNNNAPNNSVGVASNTVAPPQVSGASRPKLGVGKVGNNLPPAPATGQSSVSPAVSPRTQFPPPSYAPASLSSEDGSHSNPGSLQNSQNDQDQLATVFESAEPNNAVAAFNASSSPSASTSSSPTSSLPTTYEDTSSLPANAPPPAVSPSGPPAMSQTLLDLQMGLDEVMAFEAMQAVNPPPPTPAPIAVSSPPPAAAAAGAQGALSPRARTTIAAPPPAVLSQQKVFSGQAYCYISSKKVWSQKSSTVKLSLSSIGIQSTTRETPFEVKSILKIICPVLKAPNCFQLHFSKEGESIFTFMPENDSEMTQWETELKRLYGPLVKREESKFPLPNRQGQFPSAAPAPSSGAASPGTLSKSSSVSTSVAAGTAMLIIETADGTRKIPIPQPATIESLLQKFCHRLGLNFDDFAVTDIKEEAVDLSTTLTPTSGTTKVYMAKLPSKVSAASGLPPTSPRTTDLTRISGSSMLIVEMGGEGTKKMPITQSTTLAAVLAKLCARIGASVDDFLAENEKQVKIDINMVLNPTDPPFTVHLSRVGGKSVTVFLPSGNSMDIPYYKATKAEAILTEVITKYIPKEDTNKAKEYVLKDSKGEFVDPQSPMSDLKGETLHLFVRPSLVNILLPNAAVKFVAYVPTATVGSALSVILKHASMESDKIKIKDRRGKHVDPESLMKTIVGDSLVIKEDKTPVLLAAMKTNAGTKKGRESMGPQETSAVRSVSMAAPKSVTIASTPTGSRPQMGAGFPNRPSAKTRPPSQYVTNTGGVSSPPSTTSPASTSLQPLPKQATAGASQRPHMATAANLHRPQLANPTSPRSQASSSPSPAPLNTPATTSFPFPGAAPSSSSYPFPSPSSSIASSSGHSTEEMIQRQILQTQNQIAELFAQKPSENNFFVVTDEVDDTEFAFTDSNSASSPQTSFPIENSTGGQSENSGAFYPTELGTSKVVNPSAFGNDDGDWNIGTMANGGGSGGGGRIVNAYGENDSDWNIGTMASGSVSGSGSRGGIVNAYGEDDNDWNIGTMASGGAGGEVGYDSDDERQSVMLQTLASFGMRSFDLIVLGESFTISYDPNAIIGDLVEPLLSQLGRDLNRETVVIWDEYGQQIAPGTYMGDIQGSRLTVEEKNSMNWMDHPITTSPFQ